MKKLLILLLITFTITVCEQNEGQAKASEKSLLTCGSSVQTLCSNCTRGVAEPIIKKSIYPNSIFVLQPDSISGIETVAFDNGDRLIIKNWGCEYYILTFRFETHQLQHDTTNLEFWYKNAGTLMTKIMNGLDTPIDIPKGITQLLNQADKHQSLKLGTEIDFGNGEIRSFVSVNRVERLKDNKYAVEISFATGPL